MARTGLWQELGASSCRQAGHLASSAQAAAVKWQEGRRPRNIDVRRRIVFLEEDVNGIRHLTGLFALDISALLSDRPDQDDRMASIANVLAGVLAVMGADPETTGDWAEAITLCADSEHISNLSMALIADLLLRHGGEAGQA